MAGTGAGALLGVGAVAPLGTPVCTVVGDTRPWPAPAPNLGARSTVEGPEGLACVTTEVVVDVVEQDTGGAIAARPLYVL